MVCMEFRKRNSLSLIFKKAPFPAIMAILSFILFLGLYWLLTFGSIKPYYIIGLIFALPFLTYATIAFYTSKGKIGKVSSAIITMTLIIVFVIATFMGLVFIAFDEAANTTTDIGKYEKALRITGYPDNHLTEHFPDKIPDNAQDLVFSYNPAFLQGGESLGLRFSIDQYTISKYLEEFSQAAKKIGKIPDRFTMVDGIYSSDFEILGYTVLPEDFTIFIIVSKPYESNDWNHGETSIVAISQERNEIIFLANDW